jgi:GTPase SAR1 family protein
VSSWVSCLVPCSGDSADGSVYDVSSRDTFDELLKWFQELDTYCGDGVVKVLVGNKVDKVS